jgi:hypothetical protein
MRELHRRDRVSGLESENVGRIPLLFVNETEIDRDISIEQMMLVPIGEDNRKSGRSTCGRIVKALLQTEIRRVPDFNKYKRSSRAAPVWRTHCSGRFYRYQSPRKPGYTCWRKKQMNLRCGCSRTFGTTTAVLYFFQVRTDLRQVACSVSDMVNNINHQNKNQEEHISLSSLSREKLPQISVEVQKCDIKPALFQIRWYIPICPVV